tara:strand:- start:7863 stop:8324 length:462 start_codon:yes stop_codon:yes gene_type:complete
MTESTSVKKDFYYATGRRKNSSARVFLRSGTGKISVNGKALNEYFSVRSLEVIVQQPIEALKLAGKFDLYITVRGGGISGQAGAIRHGLARVLVSYDEATTVVTDEDENGEGNPQAYRPVLKKAGYLTRDSRVVERKKFGLKKARKREQYSKR